MTTDEPTRPSSAVGVIDGIRARLNGPAKRRVRAITDPLAGPVGSIRGIRTEDPVLGLTFDDGPDPAHTPGVLDALSARAATATWFVLVDRAEAHPELVRRMLDEGHDVGLHGVDHTRLTDVPRADLAEHVTDGVRRLTAVMGTAPRWFRPPFGAQNLASFRAARRQDLEVVVWSADCDDWSDRPEPDIASTAVHAATPGSLLLLHDGYATDPRAPEEGPALDRVAVVHHVLDGLAARGLRSLSLSELLTHGNAHRTVWFRS